jgi:hypothetical protein
MCVCARALACSCMEGVNEDLNEPEIGFAAGQAVGEGLHAHARLLRRPEGPNYSAKRII